MNPNALAIPSPAATLKQRKLTPFGPLQISPSMRAPSVRIPVCLTVFLLLPIANPIHAVEPPAAVTFPVKALGVQPTIGPPEHDDGLKKVAHELELVDPVSPEAPPRAYEVIQSLDKTGFPVGYCLSFETHVCNDNQCLPVNVTMSWDALGYYTRLTYPPGRPLTKKEHIPFTAADYAKLDRILKDRSSILKTWTLDFLDKPLEPVDVVPGVIGVDAMTAPTPTTVKDSVIEDAAYTSWALWHWANGEIVPKLRQITEQRCTPAFLKHLLASEDRRHADYALAYIIEHHPTDPQFVKAVVHILENGEREQIAQTLTFLEQAIPDKQTRYDQLISSCARMHAADSPIVLQKLASDPELSPATLEALTEQLSELPYFPIHLILRILEQRKFSSETTLANVAALLDGDDFFVARRAYEHLASQNLTPNLQSKINAFREKNHDRL